MSAIYGDPHFPMERANTFEIPESLTRIEPLPDDHEPVNTCL
jgi:hypothetical protein